MPISLADLRRFTVARNFYPLTTLKRVLYRMGFVQADPIRAPARAQDLILRQRVRDYHAGDLERRYPTLEIEEDFFITYGFVTRPLQALMHPRSDSLVPAAEVQSPWSKGRRKDAQDLLDFVRERRAVHPREVDEHFSHGKIKNYWGGSSNATTQLLDAMHYRGLLRVVRREKGIRLYAAYLHQPAPTEAAEHRLRIDLLVDVVVNLYAPLPGLSLSYYLRRLRFAAPQWRDQLQSALERAKQRLAHTRIEGVDWYWPAAENPKRSSPGESVRLLAPFDPLVHDRRRFELYWGWVYRFEAYTPAPKRKLGYYALPLLWRDGVIGWANVSVKEGALTFALGYAGAKPREPAFKLELEAELERLRTFLNIR